MTQMPCNKRKDKKKKLEGKQRRCKRLQRDAGRQKEGEEGETDKQREDRGGTRSRNDVFGCWLFSSDYGSYHGNLINRCPTYQQGIRLHSSVNKHTQTQTAAGEGEGCWEQEKQSKLVRKEETSGPDN